MLYKTMLKNSDEAYILMDKTKLVDRVDVKLCDFSALAGVITAMTDLWYWRLASLYGKVWKFYNLQVHRCECRSCAIGTAPVLYCTNWG